MLVRRNRQDEPRHSRQLPKLDYQRHSWTSIRPSGQHHGQLEKTRDEPTLGKLREKIQQQRNSHQRPRPIVLVAKCAKKQTSKESSTRTKTFPISSQEIAPHDFHQNHSQAYGIKRKVRTIRTMIVSSTTLFFFLSKRSLIKNKTNKIKTIEQKWHQAINKYIFN